MSSTTMKSGVVTTSSAGVIDDPAIAVGVLFSYFLIADKAQSTLTPYGTVKSLKFYMPTTITNPEGILDSVKKELVDLYSDYFYNVGVDVAIDSINSSVENGAYTLVTYNIEVTVTDVAGKNYTLTKAISISNGTITNIDELMYKYEQKL